MWERRGASGGGGVIYAERAPLPSPLTVPARCTEPEGAQRAGERALGGGFSRGGARPLPALRPVSTELRGRRGARSKPRVHERSRESPRRRRQSHSAASRASRGAIAHRPAGPEPVTPIPAVPGMV